MALWEHSPLVRATIDVSPIVGASVEIAPAPGRWPEHEDGDRVTLVLGICALALARAEESLTRGHVRAVALELAAASPRDSSAALDALTARGLGFDAARVVFKLRRSAVGSVPTLGKTMPAAAVLLPAISALTDAALGQADEDLRLCGALGLEGLLGWYGHNDPHYQPPQQGLAYAFRHLTARLGEAGWEVPSGVRRAAEAHRQVRPMAGGA
jgi:hypothetical protein